MHGNKPTPDCMERELFVKWQFGTGGFLTGTRAGQDKHLTQADVGKFAILTTRFPDEDEESKRRIIGLFQIARIERQNLVIAAPQGRIRLPLEEAKELYYWAYVSTKAKKPDWRTGLCRYLEDSQVHRILEDVASTVRDENTRNEAIYLISQAFGNTTALPASGCLPEKSTNRPTAIAKARKYGPGGEGKAHRELKEWLAEHPEILGLTDVDSAHLEHPFVTGDAADIVFIHRSGKYTVVEIETTNPGPGAHQAIKYRSLLCAAKELPLNTDKVKSVLVAWSIAEPVRRFCMTYGIEHREYCLGSRK